MRLRHAQIGRRLHLSGAECGDEHQRCGNPHNFTGRSFSRNSTEANLHRFTAASVVSVVCKPGFAVSPTNQPSRNWMVRLPYAALASECVTCTIVVPC